MNTNSMFGVKVGPHSVSAPTQRKLGWPLVLGVVLIVAGFVGLLNPSLATLATVVVYGWVLFLGGVFETAGALRTRNVVGFPLRLLTGVLAILAGGVMLARPDAGALTLTLVVAGFLLIGGLFRIGSAVALKFSGWGWAALSGALTTLLGAMIWAQWPVSGVWVIGLFVSIELILRGWAWVTFALVERRLTRIA
jgi:uncharacterized membrane protein HdeD (DUF308 family)